MGNSTITSTSANFTQAIFPNATSFNTSNSTTTSSPSVTTNIPPPNPHYRSQATIITQVTLLAILGVVIVLGNLVSIVTFLKTQSLRRRCHYLVISLSFADLLVGVNDFMSVYFFLTGPQFNMFLVSLEFIDTLTGTASILTLSAISAERFFAIYFPFRHRMVKFKWYMAFTASPWIIAVVVPVLYLAAFFTRNATLYNIYTYKTFVVGSIALITILSSYASIGFKMRQSNPSAQNQNRALRDRKLAVTLLIVTLASLMTWLPLQCFLVVLYICKTCPLPHFNVLFIMKFLQFLNSAVNVFIYIIRMPEFRKAFLALFCNQGNSARYRHRQSQEISRTDTMLTVCRTNSAYTGDENQRKSVSIQTDANNVNLHPNGNADPTLNSRTNSAYVGDENQRKSVSIQTDANNVNLHAGPTLISRSNLNKDQNIHEKQCNLTGTHNHNPRPGDKAENENIESVKVGEQGQNGATNYGFSKDNADTKL